MPEGKVINFQEGDYPELEGLESGAKVTLRGEATVQMDGSGGKLVIDSMEIQTEGAATRELKNMTKQESSQVYKTNSGDDF